MAKKWRDLVNETMTPEQQTRMRERTAALRQEGTMEAETRPCRMCHREYVVPADNPHNVCCADCNEELRSEAAKGTHPLFQRPASSYPRKGGGND